MKEKWNKMSSLAVLFLGFIIMTACTEEVTVEAPQRHPLVIGQKCPMKGYVETWYGKAPVNHWTSENPNVATIGYYNGLLEACNAGKSLIVASGKKKSDSFELVVTDKGYLSQIDISDTIIIHLDGYKTIDFQSSNSIHCDVDGQIAGIISASSVMLFTYTETYINGEYTSINKGEVTEYSNTVSLVGKAVGFTQLHVYNDSVNINEYIPLMVVQE